MISLVEIIALHDRVIEKTGGAMGIRDEGGLASAVARPFHTFDGDDLHATVYDKAAALLHALCINHPFVDGNKRVALMAAAYLLHRSGIPVSVPLEEGLEFMLDVAQGRHDVPVIARRLEQWSA